MARGTACRTRAQRPIRNHVPAPKTVESVQNIQEVIDRTWLYIPIEAKAFLFERIKSRRYCGFHELAEFWSSPSVIEYTRGDITGRSGSVCGASWFIALNYLKLGKVQDARVLTLNGSFLHQCTVSIIAVTTVLIKPRA